MLRATFLADFDNFTSAVKKAEVDFRGLETGAGKVEKALNKAVDAFSGRKIVQEANLAAEAVERIGGASKLTEAEQAKVNRTVTEALSKYKALGQDAPQLLHDLEQATRKVEAATGSVSAKMTDWKGVLGSVAGAFGIAFSVGAVVNFGKSVFDSAAKIHDMAEQLGISAEAAQGFKFAAEQAGSSLDAVGTALGKMNAHLAEGDKSTVSALKQAGLNFSDIRNMKPEDAFLAITDAIAKIEDPMVQADVALKLFGKSAAELLPAIKEGFRGASDAADKMSNDTIDSLEAAGDAWGKLADKVTIVTGTLIAHAMNAAASVTNSWKGFALFAENVVKVGVGGAVAFADAQEGAAKAAAKNRDVNLSLAPAIHKTAEELAAAASEAKKYADAFNAMFGKFSGASATAEMKMLDAVFRKLADSGKLTEAQIDAIVKEAIKLQDAGGKLTPQLFAMVLATNALSPGLSTAAINMSQFGQAVKFTVPEMDAIWQSINKLMPDPKVVGITNLRDAFAGLKATDPKDMLKGVNDQLAKLNSQVGYKLTKGLKESLKSELGSLSNDLSAVIAGDMSLGKAFGNYATGVAKDFTKSALAMIPGIGPILSEFAGPIIDGLKKMFGSIFGIGTAGRDKVLDFAQSKGGFDSLHAQLLTLGAEGERLWINLTQGVGRNNPAEAAKAIESVTAALGRTPAAMAEGAGYKTIAELQLVADQAKKTYEYMRDSGLYTAATIAEAFQKSKDAQIAALGDTEKAQQDSLDAITAKYKESIDKIDSEMKSLSDSIAKEAPEEFMGIVEAQERARLADLANQKREQEAKRDAEIEANKSTFDQMLTDGQKVDQELRRLFGKALEIPYSFVQRGAGPGGYVEPPDVPSFREGSQGKYLNFGSGTLAMLHGYERISRKGESDGGGSGRPQVIQVVLPDGRVLAEVAVPYIPDVLSGYGVG